MRDALERQASPVCTPKVLEVAIRREAGLASDEPHCGFVEHLEGIISMQICCSNCFLERNQVFTHDVHVGFDMTATDARK